MRVDRSVDFFELAVFLLKCCYNFAKLLGYEFPQFDLEHIFGHFQPFFDLQLDSCSLLLNVKNVLLQLFDFSIAILMQIGLQPFRIVLCPKSIELLNLHGSGLESVHMSTGLEIADRLV